MARRDGILRPFLDRLGRSPAIVLSLIRSLSNSASAPITAKKSLPLAGLAAARARGRVGGRKSLMTPEKVEVARQMYDSQEHTVEVIAKTLGVSRKTIYRSLQRAG